MMFCRTFTIVAAFFTVSFASVLAAEESAAAPVKIGWIGPLTGNAAGLGVDSMPAAQIAVDEINAKGGVRGRKLELVVEDDQYITAKTVTAYNKLVHQDGIKALIVLTYGGLLALAPSAEKDNVLLIDPLDCDEAIAALPQNSICIAKTSEDLGYYPAEDVARKNLLPTAIIHFDGDPFMPTVARAVVRRLKELGKTVALTETYNDSTTDFKPLLLKAKNIGVKSIFFLGYDQIGLAMRQARDLGITAQFYSLMTISTPGFRSLAGSSSEGVIGPVWLAPHGERYADFLVKFKKATKRVPNMDLCTVPSYDVVRIIAEELKKGALDGAAGKIDVAKLRAGFYGLKDYDGLSGLISMDPDGITRSFKLGLFTMRGNVFVPEAEPKP